MSKECLNQFSFSGVFQGNPPAIGRLVYSKDEYENVMRTFEFLCLEPYLCVICQKLGLISYGIQENVTRARNLKNLASERIFFFLQKVVYSSTYF